MRKVAVLALLPLLAAGLQAQAVPIQGQVVAGASRTASAERPLSVKVLPPEPHFPLRYVVSEPAYVAAFLIYPGAGVRMIYPEVNTSERVQWAGYHTEQLFQRRFDDDLYNVVLGPTYRAGGGPVYLYVVASRYPLDVARYVHRPSQLARNVGVNNSRSFFVDVAFDALMNNAVAVGDDSSWDADVYMLWPDPVPGYTTPIIPMITLRCASGAMISLPANYPFLGCPGESRVVPRAPAPTPPTAQQTALVQAPTVLPSIVGVRRMPTDPDAKGDATHVAAFTVANGSETARAVAPSAPTPTAVVDRPILLDPERARVRSEAWRDAHQRRDPETRNRERDGGNQTWSRDRAESGAEARAPRMAPPPQLAPAPRLAPNPEAAPRPQENPRMESPRIERAPSPPSAMPSASPATGHGAVNSSAGAPERPAATQPVNRQ